MPAYAYYLLIKAANDRLIEQNLQSLFFAVTAITPFDEFFLIGKALKYSYKGLKSVNYAKARNLLSIKPCVLKPKYKKLFAGHTEKLKKYVKFGEDVANTTGVLKLIDRLGDYKGIRNKLESFNDNALKSKFLNDFAESGDEIWKKLDANDGKLLDSWKVLNESGSLFSKNIRAIYVIDLLKLKKVKYKYVKEIIDLDDIHAFWIAENLAKRTTIKVPPQQISAIVRNAKKIEDIRPEIMNEIEFISGNSRLLNAAELNGFLDNAVKNQNKSGWKYELDILKRYLNNGDKVQFSKQIPMKNGGAKEIDIIDFTKMELVEIKSYSSKNWTSIAKKFGDDVGKQFGKIDDSFRLQFKDCVGYIRIEKTANNIWFTANKTELISNIKKARKQHKEIIIDMDNISKLIIENEKGIHILDKALWE